MHRSITLSQELRVSAPEACWAMSECTAQVVTGRSSTLRTVDGPYCTELRVATSETVITHRATVHLTPVSPGPSNKWHLRILPTGAARLLPVFTGTISVEEDPGGTRLVLAGTYEQPLGRLGALGNGLLGGLAERSLQEFLDSLAARIEVEADACVPEGGRPPPYPPDFRRTPAAETWLG